MLRETVIVSPARRVILRKRCEATFTVFRTCFGQPVFYVFWCFRRSSVAAATLDYFFCDGVEVEAEGRLCIEFFCWQFMVLRQPFCQ